MESEFGCRHQGMLFLGRFSPRAQLQVMEWKFFQAFTPGVLEAQEQKQALRTSGDTNADCGKARHYASSGRNSSSRSKSNSCCSSSCSSNRSIGWWRLGG